MYKPAGYTSLAPYLIVADAGGGAGLHSSDVRSRTAVRLRGDDGAIHHAEIRVDDTILMTGQAPGGSPAHVQFYMPDVDAAFDKALAAGGTVV